MTGSINEREVAGDAEKEFAIFLSELVTYSVKLNAARDGMKLNRRMSWLVIALFCCAAFSIHSSWAQPAAPAGKTVAILAGHLLDVRTGKTLSNQIIVIQGDKIASVGPDSMVPAGAQVIDLSNATVLPGLIDAHTHVTMPTNFGYSRLATSVPREALIGARNAG